MTSVKPLALLIESDLGLLSKAERVLKSSRYQTIARLSPYGLLDVASTLRPELILLGMAHWDRGWAQFFRVVSPDTLVFPLGETPESPGVLGVERLQALLGQNSSQESHAA